jgi:hypothetical protein
MNYLFSTKDNNSGNEKLKMMNFLGGTDILQIKTCVEMNIKIIIWKSTIKKTYMYILDFY